MYNPITIKPLSIDQRWGLYTEDGTKCGEARYYTYRWDVNFELQMEGKEKWSVDASHDFWGQGIDDFPHIDILRWLLMLSNREGDLILSCDLEEIERKK